MKHKYWNGSAMVMIVLAMLSLFFGACGGTKSDDTDKGQSKLLPPVNKQPLPTFSFTNQDNEPITQGMVKGKVHVMDFFFTSCPTICPKMKANMLTVYERYKMEDGLVMVSHSIDTRHDSVPVLKKYADRLEVSTPRWHFVTGEKEKILGIARDYLVSALEDSLAPGGYAHSGAMILFDRERNIRGFYDGTSEEETAIMIKDIRTLLNE